MAYLLALVSAALYGAGDFLGGLSCRRASTIAVVVVVQAAGLPLLALLLFLIPGVPSWRDLMWGAGAGVAGSGGLAFLYRGLAVGTMAVVAPITAVCAVVIPVAVALALGERPSAITLGGIGLALVSVVLVGQERTPDASTGAASARALAPGIGLALLSGVAIGIFFLLLARTSPAAGLWPLVGSRSVSLVFFIGLALGTRRSLRIARPVVALAVTGGAIDMLANAAYLLATRYGSLSVVVTLSSLYPASTVLLARLVLGERLSAWQAAGVVCALVAVALIVGG